MFKIVFCLFPVAERCIKMPKNIVAEISTAIPMDQQKVEIVERKGIGHPDSIADGLSESVSRSLCKMYKQHFNQILHHNTDETQIVGGQSAPKFGGGEVLEPIYILLVGRAITEVRGERLPYRSTAIEAAKEYLDGHFPNLDVKKHTMLDCKIGKGSIDLVSVYETKKMLANDTSFGVGFAPFSDTENITKGIEHFLNGDLKGKHPEIGEDIKVMSARDGNDIKITIAIAMVDKYIPDGSHYQSMIEDIKSEVHDYAAKITSRGISVDINTADDYEKDVYYLTVTGLSMENGDDGSVGRGNRVSGLITPYRPMSMEAAAGKNPVTHVGKLYNLLSMRIADDVVKQAGGNVKESRVWLLSQIGKPINEPKMCCIKIIPAEGANQAALMSDATAVADQHLEAINQLTEDIISEKLKMF
jgi:S-adenosylmethionine synthetase